jgi:hypothetical protein
MTRLTLGIIAIVILVIGFVAGFVARPLLLPVDSNRAVETSLPSISADSAVRGVQYFVAHPDEARRVVAGCREGTARGHECANAETAIVTVESKERFRRFREDR